MATLQHVVSAEAVARLGAAREEIAEAAIARYRAQPAGLSEAGRAACREDTAHHLDYLIASLITRTTAGFEAYAAWLAEVLAARGIAADDLAASFAAIDGWAAQHLDAADAAAVSEILGAGAAALRAPAPPGIAANGTAAAVDGVEELTALLLEGAVEPAGRAVERHLDGGLGLVDVEVRLLQPALYRVGVLWQHNRISVAQEHLATATAQHLMARAYAHARFAPPIGRRALFACVPGNHHALGPRMVADAFETAGWTVQYLGADTPVPALLSQVERWRPQLVGLSVSLVEQFPALQRTVTALQAQFGAQCPRILVGGIGPNVLGGAPGLEGVHWAPGAAEAVECAA